MLHIVVRLFAQTTNKAGRTVFKKRFKKTNFFRKTQKFIEFCTTSVFTMNSGAGLAFPSSAIYTLVLVGLFHAPATTTATPDTICHIRCNTEPGTCGRASTTARGDGTDDASAAAKCNQELTAYYGGRLKIRLSIPVQSRHARLPKQRCIMWAVTQSSKPRSQCSRLLTA